MNYIVEVKKPIEFLAVLLDRYQNVGTLSMEGDLSTINLSQLLPIGNKPTELLPKQGMLTKRNRYISIKLNEETVPILMKQVIPRIGLRQRVSHVQIAVGNCQVLGAYDWLSLDCGWNYRRTISFL